MSPSVRSSSLRRKAFNIYLHMPHAVKKAVSLSLGLVPSGLLLGSDFHETYRMIQKTEFLSLGELRSRSGRALAETLLNAYRHTPYYRAALEEQGVSEKEILAAPLNILSRLPLVDKATIRDHYPVFLSQTKDKVLHDYTSTGGTSGEPFYFHIDSARSAKEWAFFMDQWGRVGYNLKSRRATFRGGAIAGRAGWEEDRITLERKFSSFELTDRYLAKIWPDLCAYAPDFIYAYPSTAMALCQFMKRNGRKLPSSVKAILIGSENVYDGQEAFIESVAQKRTFKWYGQSEKLVLAGECEKTKHYHAYPQYGHVEFITPQGEPARPGDFAEIVGTGFMNTVLPFIRYRTGDYCTYLGDGCPECGRNYPVFTDVRGRWTQEVLYGKEGNGICMSAINVHSDNFKHVFRYQFYQDTPGKAILRIMPLQGFSDRMKQAILNEFNRKFNGSVVVEAAVVQDIPLTERGKYRFIDQQCPAPIP